MGKLAVPVVILLDDASGAIPSEFLSATVANRHATSALTITFAAVGNQPATSFELLAGEQFIFESIGVPYEAVTVDASDSQATIVYTKV
jgi:hypothetical protein